MAVAAIKVCGIMSTTKKGISYKVNSKPNLDVLTDVLVGTACDRSFLFLMCFFFFFHQLKMSFCGCTLMFKESRRQRQQR